MFPASPSPEHSVHVEVHARKDAFGEDVSMVVGPTPQEGVELADQSCCVIAMTLLNPFPGLFQHTADALSCGFNEQFLSCRLPWACLTVSLLGPAKAGMAGGVSTFPINHRTG
jgi:hypothetical protein